MYVHMCMNPTFVVANKYFTNLYLYLLAVTLGRPSEGSSLICVVLVAPVYKRVQVRAPLSMS